MRSAWGAADQSGGPWLGSGGYVYSRLSDGSYKIEPGSPAAVGRVHRPGTSVWEAIHADLTSTGFRRAAVTSASGGSPGVSATTAPTASSTLGPSTSGSLPVTTTTTGGPGLLSKLPAWLGPAYVGIGAIAIIVLIVMIRSRRRR